MQAQRTVTSIAVSLDSVDYRVAQEIKSKSRTCYSADTFAGWQACMRPLYRVEAALRVAHHALQSTQSAMNAANKKGEARALAQMAPCIAESVKELADALVAAGVPVPEQVTEILATLHAYIGEECEA